MTRNEIETATLPALRAYLKTVDAYKGHSRDSAATLRAHALATFDWISQAEATPEPEGVEYPKANLMDVLRAKPEATPEPTPEVKPVKVETNTAERASKAVKKRASRFNAAIASALNGADPSPGESIILTAADLQAAGYSRAYWQQRAGWSPSHPAAGGRDAAESGYHSATRKDTAEPGGFVVVLTPSEHPVQVSRNLTRKMMAAIAASEASDSGSITLTGEALALAGVGASWTKLPRTALNNPVQFHARLLAACGFTGDCSKGVLTLTPIAEAAEAAA